MFLAALAVFAGPTDPAQAGGKNVAIIDNFDGYGSFWCQFLTDHGHACTVFPKEGPTGSLDGFDAVIDASHIWSDPSGTLADLMRAGKTVITLGYAPGALGIDSDPTVQAWIGANASVGGGDGLVTVARDPILGNRPPGTEIGDCFPTFCPALNDTSGHPDAKVLARYEDGLGVIGIMRNFWEEGGVSVYMTGFSPEFILNALEVRNPIPALSGWALLALALGVSIAGTLILRRRVGNVSAVQRGSPRPPHNILCVVFLALLAGAGASVKADVTTTQENGVTYLRLASGEPFHSTDKTVANLRSVAIPNSAGVAVLWEEIDANALREPFYAVSLDGKSVDEVRATSYDLQLRYARFDPAVGQRDGPCGPPCLPDDPRCAHSHGLRIRDRGDDVANFDMRNDCHSACGSAADEPRANKFARKEVGYEKMDQIDRHIRSERVSVSDGRPRGELGDAWQWFDDRIRLARTRSFSSYRGIGERRAMNGSLNSRPVGPSFSEEP